MFEESASAIPSIWESMNSWFTPTVFFVLLNAVIATIVFTSTTANQNQQQNGPQHQNIARSPSVLQRLKSINFYRSQGAHQKKVTDSDTLFNPESSHEAQNFEEHSRYFFQSSHQESFQENLETTQEEQAHNVSRQDLHETQGRLIFEEEKVTHLDFQEVYEQKAEKNELQSMADDYSEVNGNHFILTELDTEPACGEIPVKLPARMIKSASFESASGHFEEDIVEARRPATASENGNSKLPEDHEVDAKADDFINKFKHQLKLQRLDPAIRYKDMIG